MASFPHTELMNFENYKKEFKQKALLNGYSNETIDHCLKYAAGLADKEAPLPIIYNPTHFSALVGYKKNYITRAVFFTKYFYKKYKIPKSKGGFRTIDEPLPSLKEIQIWLLNNVLYKIPISRFAKAYVKGHSLKSNLNFHKNQPLILTLDISDFFSSIKRNSIQTIFKRCGYSDLLANLFGKLCCLNDILPQGAPTSPCLSNIFLIDFDEEIGRYCIPRQIRYTRYADDMIFSGRIEDVNTIINLVRKELARLELSLNESKINIMNASQRQIVTGIVVNEKPQVPRIKRKKIRQEIYFIKEKGLAEHLRFIKNNKANYIPHLLGQINFVLHINPHDKEFLEYKKYLHSLNV